MAKDRREEHKAYYATNREAILARTATYRRNNAVKMKQCRDTWRAANPGKIQRSAYVRYGYPKPTRVMPEQCECCSRVAVLCLDHCHKTGKFRGWICGSCNRGAGLLGDTLAGARNLVRYLEKNS